MRNYTALQNVAVVLLACALVSAARAEAVAGKVFSLSQPDETVLQVRIWGDEFYTVVESLDGYTLVRDPLTDYICYAALAPDHNSLVSTAVPVGAQNPALLGLVPHLRINQQAVTAQVLAAREAFDRHTREFLELDEGEPRGPTVGKVQGICLLIDFPDDVGTIAPSAVADFCNKVGYNAYNNNGSIYDYLYEVSGALLEYTNYVPPVYYRAQNPKKYYNDPNIPFGVRARQLMLEALQALDNAGLDFSQFDADKNGFVDAVNCFYAGNRNTAWAVGLWPHASSVNFCADGVCTRNYQMTDMGNLLTIATFTHENGHMLMGWPDLYDYDYDSAGVGQFCLMAYTNTDRNPQWPSAYMRDRAGWTTTITLTNNQANLDLPVGNKIYKFPHPTKPNEYFLIENRNKAGRDVNLPDAGLALWHIDRNGNNSWQQMLPDRHYLVTLVQSDNFWHLEHNVNNGDTNDFWSGPFFRRATPATKPNTSWWDGSASGLHVLDITNPGPQMTFTFRVPGPVLRGDLNCDSVVNSADVNPFVLAISNPAQWEWNYPPCTLSNADLNADGRVDFGDINPFIEAISAP